MSRPPLRVIDGLREQIADSNEELNALRADMRAAAARLRLVAYSSIWDAPVRKRVEREAERLEAQAAGSERVA